MLANSRCSTSGVPMTLSTRREQATTSLSRLLEYHRIRPGAFGLVLPAAVVHVFARQAEVAGSSQQGRHVAKEVVGKHPADRYEVGRDVGVQDLRWPQEPLVLRCFLCRRQMLGEHESGRGDRLTRGPNVLPRPDRRQDGCGQNAGRVGETVALQLGADCRRQVRVGEPNRGEAGLRGPSSQRPRDLAGDGRQEWTALDSQHRHLQAASVVLCSPNREDVLGRGEHHLPVVGPGCLLCERLDKDAEVDLALTGVFI